MDKSEPPLLGSISIFHSFVRIKRVGKMRIDPFLFPSSGHLTTLEKLYLQFQNMQFKK